MGGEDEGLGIGFVLNRFSRLVVSLSFWETNEFIMDVANEAERL